ncbi:isopenicillin N synthase family dioxygenase [Tunicatimonas pelagia]|uniref:isopenicillin N synthase family dioxygenase n=1 Tax=Tunicatimonas pelagia TaxID=931531 RepID=UPI0026654518|nr:2-oxoglutarate and iron-dependent oxygenase domain-containing protein [Tunicatimonas pelagia]WKN43549.1 2-oxoglutarate and iron-dependent oxygenase domain-containing protein [Tunicatimonas pelagia]
MKPYSVPIIDISPLVNNLENPLVAKQISEACREVGFFYVVGHGVSEALQHRLENLSQQFFALSEETKLEIRMSRGGKAWRGYFPVGDELTSGKPDLKEGVYFGEELRKDDLRVQAGLPLHGANLFPESLPAFRETVLEYMDAMTQLGYTLMRGISLSLGLEANYFSEHFTSNALTLFRMFHYPSSTPAESSESWGVGEHTDYGLLTILKQDQVGGLQVKTKQGWIDAPPVDNSFVCNIGDMLDRITRGLYRSTPHRVLNRSGQSRYSYPFFFDPDFGAKIFPADLSNIEVSDNHNLDRWDQTNIHAFDGTYGEYLLAKVSKVFPELQRGVINNQ